MTLNHASQSGSCAHDACGCGGDGPDQLRGRLWKRLRSIRPSWLDRDVVAAGVISALNENGGRVSVTLDPSGARIGAERNELIGPVRRVLEEDDAVTDVRVQWRLPRFDSGRPDLASVKQAVSDDEENEASRPMTPLQAELLEKGVLPEPDVMGRSRDDPRAAEAAGYRDGSPSPLPGPSGSGSGDRYERDTPVFQWEVDPTDPDRPVGEADLERDGWEHRIWWQVHPRGLAYASIQAMPTPESTDPSSHPMGRAVAVNLVYDLEREGVVAAYGTAGDFRPFVSVFMEAFSARAAPSEEQREESAEAEAIREREERR